MFVYVKAGLEKLKFAISTNQPLLDNLGCQFEPYVMGVQAGAVRRVLREEQEREREMLLAVEQTGREAVAEMRRLIGLLRTEEDGIAAPSPSLSHVERLAA